MRPNARTRPFPWGSLDSTTHGEVALLRDARLRTRALARLEGVAGAVEELLGARFDVIAGGAKPLGLAQPLDGAVGVLLSPADHARHGAILLEVERALAGAVAAHAVRRPPPVLVGSSEPSPHLAGAFAAVALAVGRRAHAGLALRVTGAGPAALLEGNLERSAAELVGLSLTVLLGDDAYAARVVVSRKAQDARPPDWNAERLRRPSPACKLWVGKGP